MKENLKAKAESNVEEMNKLYKDEILESIKGSKIYSPDSEFDCSFNPVEETKFIVEDTDSVSAVLRYSKDKTAVLNFASYKYPGGGFITGMMAQEEALCHSSTLYNVISTFTDYYEWNQNNKNKGLYKDRGIYSPNIIFDDNVKCNVITVAAPNKTLLVRYNAFTEDDNRKALYSRIRLVLNIAKENNIETLILGAYGCGVFKQNPTEVATCFKELLNSSEFKNCFRTVVFAIPNSKNNNYNSFKKVITK